MSTSILITPHFKRRTSSVYLTWCRAAEPLTRKVVTTIYLRFSLFRLWLIFNGPNHHHQCTIVLVVVGIRYLERRRQHIVVSSLLSSGRDDDDDYWRASKAKSLGSDAEGGWPREKALERKPCNPPPSLFLSLAQQNYLYSGKVTASTEHAYLVLPEDFNWKGRERRRRSSNVDHWKASLVS